MSTGRRGGAGAGAGISADTQRLVESMMRESGVNHRKAQLIKTAMQTVGSLPAPKMYQPAEYRSQPARQRPLNPNNADRGRKTGAKIEREVRANPVVRDAPLKKGVDRDWEREKLARHMQFEGAVPQVAPRKKVAVQEKPEEQLLQERFVELMQQVDENEDFLAQMGAMGHREKYRGTVNAEIASKVNEMREIDARLGR